MPGHFGAKYQFVEVQVMDKYCAECGARRIENAKFFRNRDVAVRCKRTNSNKKSALGPGLDDNTSATDGIRRI
jgi:hypothetical protein